MKKIPVKHKQTLWVNKITHKPKTVLIKQNGTRIETSAIEERIVTDSRGRQKIVNATQEVIGLIAQNPERYYNDENYTGLREKQIYRGQKSAKYVSHIAAESNFGKANLPRKYRVLTKDGNRENFSPANQKIARVK